MIYGGIKVRADQEILTTVHEHYATAFSLDFRVRKEHTQVRKIRLFKNPRIRSRPMKCWATSNTTFAPTPACWA